MTLVSALERQISENKTSLSYRMNFRIAKAIQRIPVSTKQTKTKRGKKNK